MMEKGQKVKILHGYHAKHVGIIEDVWYPIQWVDVHCECFDMPDGDVIILRWSEVEVQEKEKK